MSYQLRRRNKSKIWTCRIKLKCLGAPKDFSTGVTDKAEANKIAALRHDELKSNGTNSSFVGGTLHLTCKVMRDWDCRRVANEATNLEYATKRVPEYWDAIESFFKDFASIDADTLQAYVNFRKGPDKANPRMQNQSIKQELYCLKRGLKFAQSRGYKATIPELWPKLTCISKSFRAGRYYTHEQILAFLHALKNHDNRGSILNYQYAIFVLGTGMRHGELARVTQLWLRRPEKHDPQVPWILEIPQGARKVKTRAHKLALTNTVAEAWKALPGTFHNFQKAWDTASKRAGLEHPMHARSLRHAFASAAAGCLDAKAVDIAMNHKKGVPAIYQHGDEISMARVMAAVAKAFPILAP